MSDNKQSEEKQNQDQQQKAPSPGDYPNLTYQRMFTSSIAVLIITAGIAFLFNLLGESGFLPKLLDTGNNMAMGLLGVLALVALVVLFFWAQLKVAQWVFQLSTDYRFSFTDLFFFYIAAAIATAIISAAFSALYRETAGASPPELIVFLINYLLLAVIVASLLLSNARRTIKRLAKVKGSETVVIEESEDEDIDQEKKSENSDK